MGFLGLFLPIFLLSILSAPPSSLGWGKEGHIMVCKIAEVITYLPCIHTHVHEYYEFLCPYFTKIETGILIVVHEEIFLGEDDKGGAGPPAGVGRRGAVGGVPVGRRGPVQIPLVWPSALHQYPPCLRLQVLKYAPP